VRQPSAAEARSVTYDLDIPSQSLKDALEAFALASHHKLLYSAVLVDGKISPALKGQYTAEQALTILVSGTNLDHEVTSDGVVLIRAAGKPSSPHTAPASMGAPTTGASFPTPERQKSGSDKLSLGPSDCGIGSRHSCSSYVWPEFRKYPKRRRRVTCGNHRHSSKKSSDIDQWWQTYDAEKAHQGKPAH
jgi:Secretin and TonB N terminus short domain